MPVELTLEQQLQLRVVADQINQMDLPKARRTLIEVYTLMLLKEACFKQMMAEKCGIESPVIKDSNHAN